MYIVYYEVYNYYYGRWYETYLNNNGKGFTKEEAEYCADHLKHVEEWTRNIRIERM